MKVSVLIPYYNDHKYLAEAIESVLNQTMTDFELILVNHATTDNCREIAHSYNDPRIVHIDMDKNYGAGTGLIMEKFLDNARGEYIKPFCADDIMYPDCLKNLVEYMDSHPDKDFAFGNVEYINIEEKPINKTWFTNRRYFSLNNDENTCIKLFYNAAPCFLPYIGSIVKTKKIKESKIDKSFIPLYDITLWLRLLINGCKIGYLNKKIAGYRIHEGQSSSLKNANKTNVLWEFESMKYAELFLDIKDYDMLVNLFPYNKFIKRGIILTEEDFKFIIAYELLSNNIKNFQRTGYWYLYDMLQNEEKRLYLEEKFNFSIKDFRQMYGIISINDMKKSFSVKGHFYFLLKKLLEIITFSEKRIKKIKNDSL